MKFADLINNSLVEDESYLGAKDVSFVNVFDYILIKNGLVEQFLIHGNHVDYYYQIGMGIDDYRNISWEELFKDMGFEFDYLEQGGRNTIYDEYRSIEHYDKIEKFTKAYFINGKISQNEMDDFVFYLEEINQSLFDKLYASTKVASEAITSEEFSLASLAGRRFIETLADIIFTPQDEKFENMVVNKESYINRIMAYVFIQTKNKDVAYRYKNRTDKILAIFHKGVHKQISENEFYQNLDALILLLLDIIKISPYAIRNPYIAYEKRLDAFLAELESSESECDDCEFE